MSTLLNFPPALTPFKGRAAELTAMHTLLAAPTQRLITLVGPGGMGKTRLALHAAAHAPGFPDGAVFVPLAGVVAPEFVAPAIAAVLSLPLDAKTPPAEQLAAVLHGKALLLVLDNAEHLRDGLTLLADLLAAVPGLRVLVTSRVRLGLHQEAVFEVTGLDVPPPATTDAPDSFGAVQVFLQTAARVAPRFAPTAADLHTIAAICRQMDGWPLAIELAASWVRVLSVADITAEVARHSALLDSNWADVPERHRSLRAVFASSWALLTERQRDLFQRLCVFGGTFTLAAARAVADADLPTLAALLDQSLVARGGDGRYGIHPLLRQFGEEDFKAADADAHGRARAAYSTHYLQVLADHADALMDSNAVAAMALLQVEHDNLVQAWLWAVHTHQTDALDAALEPFDTLFERAGRFFELSALLAQALDAFGDDKQPALTCRLLTRAGHMFLLNFDLAAAESALVQAAPLAERCGLMEERGRIETLWGRVALNQGRLDDSEQHLAKAEAIFYALESSDLLASVFLTRALLLQRLAKLKEAKASTLRALDIIRQTGDPYRMVDVLATLGVFLNDLGEWNASVAYMHEALALIAPMDFAWGKARVLYPLATALAWGTHDYPEAARAYQQALEVWRQMGNRMGQAIALGGLGDVALLQADYDTAQTHFAAALALQQQLANHFNIGLQHRNLGHVARQRGDAAAALYHYRTAVTIAREMKAVAIAFMTSIGLALLFTDMGQPALAAAMLSTVRHHPNYTLPARERENWLRLLDAVEQGPYRRVLTDWRTARLFVMAHLDELATYLERAALEWFIGTVDAAHPEAAEPAPPLAAAALSEREVEVLRLLALGWRNAQIAAHLNLGEATVKTYTLNIYRKLGVGGRTEAVARARQLALL